jgi:aldose 1-epimerase
MKNTIGILVLLSVLLTACGKAKQQEVTTPGLTVSGLDSTAFKGLYDGKENHLYVIKNGTGMEVCITNFGGRIVSLLVPDKDGNTRDVVLGLDSFSEYLKYDTNYGAIIGRYGNRILKGFTLNGQTYDLLLNDGENCLHGGPKGFHNCYFDIEQPDVQTLICRYLSPDGEAGFPGNLNVTVKYALTDDNTLNIYYEAETDKPTVVNLTNHAYFNLSGDPNRDILDHVLYINADRYTPVNDRLIPTGEIAGVENTAFDFTTPTAIGDRIETESEQLAFGAGYDHNWVFKASNTVDSVACKLVCPATGISLKIFTTEPAVQFYSGNFLDGTQIGKKGIAYRKRTALCLETQHYPDSPNHPDFPSTQLNPGENYTSYTVYQFGIEN